jgi:hypothetical protein
VKVIKAILTVVDWAAMAILFLGCVALGWSHDNRCDIDHLETTSRQLVAQ